MPPASLAVEVVKPELLRFTGGESFPFELHVPTISRVGFGFKEIQEGLKTILGGFFRS
jgi:hypothetical protein